MPKLVVAFWEVTPKTMFVVFNVFDILLYITGMTRASVIIYDAINGRPTIPSLDLEANKYFGMMSLGGLLVMSTWTSIQIYRFVHFGTLLQRNQQWFFVVKTCLCICLIVGSILLIEYFKASLVYTGICIAINSFQTTWAVQLFRYIKRTLDLEEIKKSQSASDIREGLII